MRRVQDASINHSASDRHYFDAACTSIRFWRFFILGVIMTNKCLDSVEEEFKKDLYEKYFIERLTIKELEEYFKVSKSTIRNKLKKYNIPNRPLTKDLSGQTINNLKVLRKATDVEMSDFNSKNTRWLCLCTTCETQCFIRGDRLKKGGQKHCNQCSNKAIGERNWKGCGELGMRRFSQFKKSAETRGIDFNITIEQCWELFLKQERKCAISGVEISFSDRQQNFTDATASLDRIDSRGSYTLDNIQWVHKNVNTMKWDLNQEDFINWCHKISLYNT